MGSGVTCTNGSNVICPFRVQLVEYNNCHSDNKQMECLRDHYSGINNLIKQTHYMMFHRTRIKNKAAEDRVHLCGINLISVSNTKFLGVIIDSKLNWSDYTNMRKKYF